jgi:hypothetical protein
MDVLAEVVAGLGFRVRYESRGYSMRNIRDLSKVFLSGLVLNPL